MITRRLFGTGLVASVAGTTGMAASTADVAVGEQRDREQQDVAEELKALRGLMERQRSFTEIAEIRDAQKLFLRQNGKLPDYIDVGSDIWFRAYDWHIRWQQPVPVARDAQGRHTLVLLHTTVIMRPDVVSTFMSLPYDAPGR